MIYKYLFSISILCFTISLHAENLSFFEVKADTSKGDEFIRPKLVKVTPFSFLLGYTSIGYEKAIKKGRSFEIKTTLIGAGMKRAPTNGQLGMAATLGYKFIKQPKNPMYRHILKGGYFRPDLTLAVYKEKYIHRIYEPNAFSPILKKEATPISYACIASSFGYQTVSKHRVVIDFFTSLGVAAVFPINGEGVVDYARYGYLIPLDRTKGEKVGFSYALKFGFLIGSTL